jgi:FkbM family methyltransferase
MIFLDIGTNLFQGLEEFTSKIHLDTNTIVYCFEPNTMVYNNSKQKYDSIKNNYKTLYHFNKAVLDYTGKILFNSHHGVWDKGKYINDYTGGSNCLNKNPKIDNNNGVVFDIHQEVVDCIDIIDVLKTIVDDNNLTLEKSISVKCDIEGSEFKILPKLLQSEYVKYIKEIHIEWHERFFCDNRNEYNFVCNLKSEIINSLRNNNIEYHEHH